jgi:hypothetical protein
VQRRDSLGASVRILFVLFVASSIAYAQPAEPKPWAAGVSDAEQKAALELYEQGNADFQAARFAQAIARYKEALKHWDHPAIHFNMAVCFINLDSPLEAKEHLDRALAYGADPLGPDLYAQGITYKHSIDGQISHLKITCREPGTTITLDGTFLFTAPGEIEKFVLPGKHQVVGTKPGFLTASETLDLLPARLTEHDVHLVALKAATQLERRWPSWQPWAVLAGGGGALAIGGLSLWFAKHEFNVYDAGVTTRCPSGCDAEMAASLSDLRSVRHHGDIAQGVGFALLGVGGAAAIVGAVGVVLNQPHAVTERPVTVAPTAGGASISIGGRF